VCGLEKSGDHRGGSFRAWRGGLRPAGCDDLPMGWLADGELLVVETEDDWFLGTVEVLPDVVVVRSRFVGRPVVLRHEDVVRVTPALEHESPEQ
jgi:hypothetical protein